MKINALNLGFINAIKETNYTSNPMRIGFRGNKRDTFESKKAYSTQEQAKLVSDIEEKIKSLRDNRASLDENKKEISKLQQKREKLIAKLNPNSAFLADATLTRQEKLKELKKHPEFVYYSQKDAQDMDGTYLALLKDRRYFIANKMGGSNYLDTSWSVNKPNYEKLSRKEVLSNLQVKEKYDMNPKDYLRYKRNGFLKYMTLTNNLTGAEENVLMLDMSDKTNKDGIKRLEEIRSKVKKISCKGKWLPIKDLARFGYGTEEDIQKELGLPINNRIHQIKTGKGDETIPCINIDDEYAVGKLIYLKNNNKRVVSAENFAAITNGCNETDIENALLSGELECVPYHLFEEDRNQIFFSLKNKKNIEFINKRNFEQSIIIQTNLKKRMTKDYSLKTALVWQLCPKTRKVAQDMIDGQPDLARIIEKNNAIKDFEEREAHNNLEPDEVKPVLTTEEVFALREYYQKMWEIAGTKEYRNATKDVTAAIREYKAGGLGAVSDEIIRDMIKDYLEDVKSSKLSD